MISDVFVWKCINFTFQKCLRRGRNDGSMMDKRLVKMLEFDELVRRNIVPAVWIGGLMEIGLDIMLSANA